jgi:hypothetical protein
VEESRVRRVAGKSFCGGLSCNHFRLIKQKHFNDKRGHLIIKPAGYDRHGRLQSSNPLTMYCQKCRTPLKLDDSLDNLNPAAFDLLIGMRRYTQNTT